MIQYDYNLKSNWLNKLWDIQVSIEIELNPRIKALQVILENAFSDGVKKVLIFAGTPGVTELLRDLLIKKYILV